MSLLDELTAELRAASDHLPLGAVRRAVTDMRSANDRLIHAIRLGSTAHTSLARLGAATSHLEAGAGLMMRAQDEVGAYLTAIGAHARMHTSPTVPAVENDDVTWWARRVTLLTGESGPACDDPARTGPELLDRVVTAVRANDRAQLHAQLLGAGACVGSSLTGRATIGLSHLAADLLGRPATVEDVPALHSRTGSLGDLLPHLPSAVVTTLLRRACAAVDAGGHEAVDLAVGSAVLVARVCCTLGREKVLDG